MRSASCVSAVLDLGNQSSCTASIAAVGTGFCRKCWSTDVALEGARLYGGARSAQVIPRHQGQVEAVNQNDIADGDATSICCDEASTLHQSVLCGAGHSCSRDQHYLFSLVKASQGASGMWRGTERVCFGEKFRACGVVTCLLWGQEGAQPNVEYEDCAGRPQ